MPKKQPQKSRQPKSKLHKAGRKRQIKKGRAPRSAKSAVKPVRAKLEKPAAKKEHGIQVLDGNGKASGTVALDASIAGSELHSHLIYDAARAAQANRRVGTVKTKTRAEISGGGKKPWRQKGTGRARAGSNRSPLWRKGGTTFGPQPRDYSIRLSPAVRTRALVAVLKVKAEEGKLFMVEGFASKDGKTREMAGLVSRFPVKKALVVTEARDPLTLRAARNIPNLALRTSQELASFDLMSYEGCVFTRKGYAKLLERLKAGAV